MQSDKDRGEIMNIEVKGINDILIFQCQEESNFQDIMEELERLLDQPIFQQDGYYPKAFFDFGCRQLEKKEIQQLIELLIHKKKVLFDGISLPQQNHHIDINKQIIHNGEEVHVYNETLFLGIVKTGSYIYCYQNVYFLNKVQGTIVALNGNIKIYGHHFSHAKIVINRKVIHDLTTSALTTVYDNGKEIVCIKEDQYDKNHCLYIG